MEEGVLKVRKIQQQQQQHYNYYTLENIVEGMRKRTGGWEAGREGHELYTFSLLPDCEKEERERKKTGWLLLFCCCFTFPTHPHTHSDGLAAPACSARWRDWFIQIGVDSVTMATPGPPKPMASPISRIRRLTFCHHHGRTRRGRRRRHKKKKETTKTCNFFFFSFK